MMPDIRNIWSPIFLPLKDCLFVWTVYTLFIMGHLLQNFEFVALFVKTNSKLNSEGAYNYYNLCSKVFIKT